MFPSLREQVTQIRARENCLCLLRCAEESIGFATVTINHKHSASLWCRLSPTPRVTGTPLWCWAERPSEWWCSVYSCMGYLSPFPVWCWIKGALRQTVCQMCLWINTETVWGCCCVIHSLKLFSLMGKWSPLMILLCGFRQHHLTFFSPPSC